MNKTELIDALAKETGVSKKDTGALLDAFVKTVTEELAKKEKVQLVGFGTFETRERAARTGRNPQTGAELKIAATTAPAFKPGKALKDAVNKPVSKKKKK
ncbi:MAG: HU family DNA-binding protein [Lachnospiraceae bacterium]|nr:HU family DNA-binding protein [Lachnospiraceae bacterium]